MVPAAAAASQIVRAPCSASSSPMVWPTALSFTDTSTRPPCVRPASRSRSSSTRYALTVASAWPASVVSSPRWSRLTVRPLAVSSVLARTASSTDSPATKRRTTLRLTGAPATRRSTRRFLEAARMTERRGEGMR